MHDELKELVQELIEKKREGDFWDFKAEHHKNKADLLHNILCMANTLHNKDCYIILGIDDKTGEMIGVENNTTRRNQQNIIDFLKSKKFAGDYRPTVELRTLNFGNHEIDVFAIYTFLHI